jgi:hypothetical protein
MIATLLQRGRLRSILDPFTPLACKCSPAQIGQDGQRRSHERSSGHDARRDDAVHPLATQDLARMEARGFPMSDELFQAANRAYDSAHALTMKLHYLSCKSGVGRSEKKTETKEREHGRFRGEP